MRKKSFNMNSMFRKVRFSSAFISRSINPNPNTTPCFISKPSVCSLIASPCCYGFRNYSGFHFFSSTATNFKSDDSTSFSPCIDSGDYYSMFHNSRGGYKGVRRDLLPLCEAIQNMQSDLFVHGFCPVPNVLEKAKVHMRELNQLYRQQPDARNWSRQYYNYYGEWMSLRQTTVSILAFLHWLETGYLISIKEIDEKLGLRGPSISEEEFDNILARLFAREQGNSVTGDETLEKVGFRKEVSTEGGVYKVVYVAIENENEEIDRSDSSKTGCEDTEEKKLGNLVTNEEVDEKNGLTSSKIQFKETEEKLGNLDSNEEIKEKSGFEDFGKKGFEQEYDSFKDFGLDIEDYIMGICSMSDKLPDYAVHQVTAGGYDCPKKVWNLLLKIQELMRNFNPHDMYQPQRDSYIEKFARVEDNVSRVEKICYDVEVFLRKNLMARKKMASKSTS